MARRIKRTTELSLSDSNPTEGSEIKVDLRKRQLSDSERAMVVEALKAGMPDGFQMVVLQRALQWAMELEPESETWDLLRKKQLALNFNESTNAGG